MGLDGYSYELSPDDLTVGGYNITIYDEMHVEVAATFFIADGWDEAERVAKAAFESEEWRKASSRGHAEIVNKGE